MKNLVLKNLAWSGPPAAVFLVFLPLASHAMDQYFGLTWPFSFWFVPIGSLLVAVGAAVALWTAYLFATFGQGTPNPIAPPKHLVVRGPYRFSRNPMMLGGWVLGLGLVLLMRSPSLLLALAGIITAGCVYVRLFEEPRLRKRYGASYEDYFRTVPRWFCLLKLKEACGGVSHNP